MAGRKFDSPFHPIDEGWSWFILAGTLTDAFQIFFIIIELQSLIQYFFPYLQNQY